MKTSPYFIFMFITLFSETALGQIDSLISIRVSVGTANPRAPESFYDYWSSGIDLNVATVYNYSSGINFSPALELSYFPFSKDRFFQKTNVMNSSVTMSGAATIIAVLTGNFQAVFFESKQNEKSIKAYAVGGAGVIVTYVSSSTIEYSFTSVSTVRKVNINPCVQIGMGVSNSMTKDVDFFIETYYLYGLTTSKIMNTDFASIRAGISVYH